MPAGGALARGPLAALGHLLPQPLARRAAHADSLASLQRLLTGRAGIALVAFALIGIVTLQLGLLKLNGGIGRALEHEAALQRENAALSIENSEMAAGDRVELGAAQIGMQYVAPGALQPLVARPASDAARAAVLLRAPATAAPLSGATSPIASEASSTGEAASGSAAAGQVESEQAHGGSESAHSSATQAGAGSAQGEAQRSEGTEPSSGQRPSSAAPSTSPSETASAGGTAGGARAAG